MNPKCDYARKFLDIRQHPGETFRAYLYRVQAFHDERHKFVFGDPGKADDALHAWCTNNDNRDRISQVQKNLLYFDILGGLRKTFLEILGTQPKANLTELEDSAKKIEATELGQKELRNSKGQSNRGPASAASAAASQPQTASASVAAVSGAQGGRSKRNRNRNRRAPDPNAPKCYYCGIPGHDADVCNRKIKDRAAGYTGDRVQGYPLKSRWQKEQERKAAGGSASSAEASEPPPPPPPSAPAQAQQQGQVSALSGVQSYHDLARTDARLFNHHTYQLPPGYQLVYPEGQVPPPYYSPEGVSVEPHNWDRDPDN